MAEDWKQYEGQMAGDNYVLRQYLGGSGHAAVFLTDHGHQKAAIKLVAASSTNAEGQLTRWSEAAKVAHPNLLQIYTTGRCHLRGIEMLFIVMEYAEENLSEVLPHRPLTAVEAIDMLRPVLGALGYLHEKGFVHTRLKPANINAIADQVKLTSDTLCRTGAANINQPDAYDPPEKDISPARDIWALGITLAEVLTLKRPALLPGKPSDPALPENLPQPFLDIVRNCLHREPQLRWNVAQILARLHQPASVTAAAERVATPAKLAPKIVPVAVTPPKAAPPKQTPKPAPATQPKKPPVKESNALPIALVGLAIIVTVIALLVWHNKRSESSADLSSTSSAQTTPTPMDTPTPIKPSAAQPAATPTPKPTPTLKPMATPKPSATPTEPTGSGSLSTAASPLPEPTVTVTTQGVAQSDIAHQDVPKISQKTRETITGKIRVNVVVTVDASGKVVDAQLESPASSKYFSDLALQSARKWQFASSAEETRQRVLRFTFQKLATDIVVAGSQ